MNDLEGCTRVYAFYSTHDGKDIHIYLGTVDDFVVMDKKMWELKRLHIMVNYGGIYLIDTKRSRDTSKLWFTSHIDKLKGIKRGKE